MRSRLIWHNHCYLTGISAIVCCHVLNEIKGEETMVKIPTTTNEYLVASDFDQTLSFNDSGLVLAEMLGIADFEKKVTGLSRSNLVQSGAELAYLLRHDPAFRSVRREHLIEAGRRVRLKDNVELFAEILN